MQPRDEALVPGDTVLAVLSGLGYVIPNKSFDLLTKAAMLLFLFKRRDTLNKPVTSPWSC